MILLFRFFDNNFIEPIFRGQTAFVSDLTTDWPVFIFQTLFNMRWFQNTVSLFVLFVYSTEV